MAPPVPTPMVRLHMRHTSPVTLYNYIVTSVRCACRPEVVRPAGRWDRYRRVWPCRPLRCAIHTRQFGPFDRDSGPGRAGRAGGGGGDTQLDYDAEAPPTVSRQSPTRSAPAGRFRIPGGDFSRHCLPSVGAVTHKRDYIQYTQQQLYLNIM